MPVYNCARFLRESVASVLGQNLKDFELILVDDGSSDGSWEILQNFTDKRIRTFRFEQNIGVGSARNFAIEKTDCEYLAFLDADDLAHPARLAIQVAHLDASRKLAPWLPVHGLRTRADNTNNCFSRSPQRKSASPWSLGTVW